MKSLSIMVLGILMLGLASSCANTNLTKGQQGAAVGAAGGALAGQAIGRNTEATLIGTAVGTMLGYIVGNEMDKYDRTQLNQAYEMFFGDEHQGSSVLTIDTDDLNYIANPKDLKWVENRIREKLRLPPYQEQLPLEITGAD